MTILDDKARRVQAAWAALKSWASEHAPEALRGLERPASQTAIESAERALGVSFPEEVSAFYRLVGGAGSDSIFGDELLSPAAMVRDRRTTLAALGEMASERSAGAKIDPEIEPVWFHDRWLPLTGDGSGNNLCVDLAPAPGGVVGQVIQFWHDDSARTVVADGIADWLDHHLARLRRGELVVIEDEYGIYEGVLHRDAMTGSLATRRIRGETTEQWQRRCRDRVQTDAGELASALWDHLRAANALELHDGSNDAFMCRVNFHRSFVQATPDTRAIAAFAFLTTDPAIADFALDLPTLDRLIAALPFADDVLPRPMSLPDQRFEVIRSRLEDCDCIGYWLGSLDASAPAIDRDVAISLSSIMSHQFDVEDQADRTGVVFREDAEWRRQFHPVAPVQLADDWSPISTALKRLGAPTTAEVVLARRPDRLVAAFTWASHRVEGVGPRKARGELGDERHFLGLVDVALMRAKERGQGLLLVVRPGWSYDWPQPTRGLQAAWQEAGFAVADRRPRPR